MMKSTVLLKQAVEPLVLDVIITAQQEHKVLKYNSLMDGALFACKGFDVVDLTTGEALEFQGAIAKRRVPEKDDYHHFDMGEEVMTSVDLTHCFHFQKDHMYEVNLNSKVSNDMNLKTMQEGIVLTATQNTAPHAKAKAQNNMKVFNNFDNCDASEIETSQSAVQNAIDALNDAVTNVLNPGCANDSYERFMGVHTQERYFIVSSNFNNILDRFNTEEYIIRCNDSGCESGVFAFVYPSDPDHTIYVCDSYWSASVTIDYDSKPGTLIHEMSHFNDVAGTDDHQYGVSGNEALAISDPCLSVNNADSHEYFIEQVPTPGATCCADLSTENCISTLSYCAVSGNSCMEISQAEESVGPDTQEGWCSGNSNCTDFTDPNGNTWYDQDYNEGGPFTCQDYADYGWCTNWGSSTSQYGQSADTACCACGGGSTGGDVNSGSSPALTVESTFALLSFANLVYGQL
jgi:peptidyl-Lys metalloendopeptidase